MNSSKRLLVLFSALVLLVTACGGSSSSENASNDTAVDTAASDTPAGDTSGDAVADTATSAAQAGDGDSASGEAKSLDDYLGVAANFVRGNGGGNGRGQGGAGDEQRTEEQRQIEQAVQLCMQSQGFEYTPQESGTGLRFFIASQSQGVSPQEYAETEGFGISTRFDAVLNGDVDLTEDANANDDYVASLSDGEADAYQVALRGQPPVRNDEGQLVDPETGEVVQGGPGRATGGCRADAQLDVRGDFSVLSELEDEFVELSERIAADPRIAEIARDWADCMRSSGFAFDTEDEARADINAEFRPLLRSFLSSAGADGATGQGRQGQNLQLVVGLELTNEQEADLAQLQDREREMAVASFGCSGDTDAEIEEITERYETEFVETNRDVLERISG